MIEYFEENLFMCVQTLLMTMEEYLVLSTFFSLHFFSGWISNESCY